jgi:hypothetical protein
VGEHSPVGGHEPAAGGVVIGPADHWTVEPDAAPYPSSPSHLSRRSRAPLTCQGAADQSRVELLLRRRTAGIRVSAVSDASGTVGVLL